MYLGIDIGGTNVRIATFNSKDSIKPSELVNFSVSKDFNEAMTKIIEEIKNFSKNQKINGIGVGLPGIINSEEGFIIRSANLGGWEKKPFGKVLSDEFKTRVIVSHDVAAAAIGEAIFGYGRKLQNFIYLIWGTGFGGTFVERVGDKLRFSSFETGHQIIDWNGIQCVCGQKGCAEAYIGGAAAERYYGKPLSEVTEGKIWNEIAQKAAHAILNSIKHYPTGTIIFGGGVISKQEHLVGRISKIVEERINIHKAPDIKLGKLGEKSALYGGLGLFLIQRA